MRDILKIAGIYTALILGAGFAATLFCACMAGIANAASIMKIVNFFISKLGINS